MFSLLLVLTITLFVFKNSLYFTIMLLTISVLTLSSLVINTLLNTLTAFMLVIVYVGAIIVLIGYICAISPNLVLEPDYSITYLFVSLFFTFTILDSFSTPTFNTSTFTLVDFFYSYQGLFVFISLVFMLFITLLIVTSQYSVPQGPFRSLQS
jgi:hypothetical protein